jgi:hypothetical protein
LQYTTHKKQHIIGCIIPRSNEYASTKSQHSTEQHTTNHNITIKHSTKHDAAAPFHNKLQTEEDTYILKVGGEQAKGYWVRKKNPPGRAGCQLLADPVHGFLVLVSRAPTSITTGTTTTTTNTTSARLSSTSTTICLPVVSKINAFKGFQSSNNTNQTTGITFNMSMVDFDFFCISQNIGKLLLRPQRVISAICEFQFGSYGMINSLVV